jgi:hypothetical protein
MDPVPALIWLSSFVGATLFFSSGRLWGKAVSVEGALDPLLRAEREARARAEQDAAAARRAYDEASRAALAEKARADEVGRVLEQREQEIERKAAEEVELRSEVERLVGALGRREPGQQLEAALEGCLDELRLHEDGCRTAVLSDTSGLLLASSGDTLNGESLAAAVSITADTTERVRQFLPLGEPLEVRLTDVNHVVITARWLRCDEGKLLLGTLGVATAAPDLCADAIGASISELISAA